MSPEYQNRDLGEAWVGLPRFEELEHLHSLLSPEERDELLQCLLIASARGGEAMINVLEQLVLCHATEELCEEHRDLGWGSAVDSDQRDVEGD